MKIDEFLPQYHKRAQYEIEVRASAAQTYAALLNADFSDSWIVRTLMRIRGYGSKTRKPSSGSLLDRMRAQGFTLLAEIPEQEVVLGVIGRFWRPDGGLLRKPASEFRHFDEPGYARAAWNFSLTKKSEQVTLLATETRIQTFGPAARRLFAAYWTLVEPFSGLIRKAMLKQVKRSAESIRAQASAKAPPASA